MSIIANVALLWEDVKSEVPSGLNQENETGRSLPTAKQICYTAEFLPTTLSLNEVESIATTVHNTHYRD